ncbi:hypothetical protein FQN60_008585, partial [Etheostoma spectabile]
MFITLLYLLLLFNSGLTVVVLQSGDQMSHPGLTVNFECSMGPGFSMGSYTMLWYRQNQYGALLEFLTKEYDQTAGRFQSSLETSKNNFSLQVTGLLLNDSSTYYCAASHSDAHGPHSVTEIAAVRLESASPSCTAALTQREMEAEIWRGWLGEGEGRQPERLQ